MKTQIVISLLILGVILLLIEPTFQSLNGGRFFALEEILLEPVFFCVAFFLFFSLYLLFFNSTIQHAWWRWARFALLVPFLIIILMLPTYQNGGGFITFGGTTDLVILWGVLFGSATVGYTLYQRFYLRTGVS